KLPAARHAELDLRATAPKVWAKGHEGQSSLRGLTDEPGDLAPAQEELSVALRVVVGIAAVAVGADVAPDEPGLLVAHRRVGVLEGHLPGTERFHLGAAQHEAGLDGLEDLVVVPGAPVRRDGAVTRAGARLTWHARTVL